MRRLTWLVVAVSLLGLAGCASTQAPPTVDISGKWQGNWVALMPSQGGGQIQMDVKQTGPKFTGNLLFTGGGTTQAVLPRGMSRGTGWRSPCRRARRGPSQ